MFENITVSMIICTVSVICILESLLVEGICQEEALPDRV
jgi:hypothetical protein